MKLLPIDLTEYTEYTQCELYRWKSGKLIYNGG